MFSFLSTTSYRNTLSQQQRWSVWLCGLFGPMIDVDMIGNKFGWNSLRRAFHLRFFNRMEKPNLFRLHRIESTLSKDLIVSFMKFIITKLVNQCPSLAGGQKARNSWFERFPLVLFFILLFRVYRPYKSANVDRHIKTRGRVDPERWIKPNGWRPTINAPCSVTSGLYLYTFTLGPVAIEKNRERKKKEGLIHWDHRVHFTTAQSAAQIRRHQLPPAGLDDVSKADWQPRTVRFFFLNFFSLFYLTEMLQRARKTLTARVTHCAGCWIGGGVGKKSLILFFLRTFIFLKLSLFSIRLARNEAAYSCSCCKYINTLRRAHSSALPCKPPSGPLSIIRSRLFSSYRRRYSVHIDGPYTK